MSITTGIEWCDSTANPAMGCDGCELWNPVKKIKVCYAGNLTVLHGGPGRSGWPESFDKPKIFPERIAKMLKWPDLTGKDREDKPWLNGYPRLIFLGDMGDNFTESLPVDWLGPYIADMAASPHIYIILTKRPARMFQFWREWCWCFGPIPENFWLLTSVTSRANVRRICELMKLHELGASVLGVSYEPAWGPIDFRAFLAAEEGHPYRLDWLIAGGQSGAGADPSHPQWFRDARDACQAAGAAFFFKQWGEWHPADARGIAIGRGEHGYIDHQLMLRVGKKAAGALLDGREWRQMPPVARSSS